ncbi:hypothetical protein V1264_005210 [Littorina saxatilis]
MEDKYACQASLLQQQHLQQQQQFAERILEHLAFNSDILERWHQIGSAQGLSTDLEVATFLIQHYENTWDRAPPTEYCLTCHSPLSLSCVKCTATTTANASCSTANMSTQHNSIAPIFDAGAENFTVEPLSTKPSKGKKKLKKGKAGKGGAAPNSIDNDEDLMGLYIQFANNSSSQIISDANQLVIPFSDVGGKAGSRLKSYICVHCGKTFFKPSDFKKHVRTHTREKPYKCDRCPAAFSDPSSASRHKRIHTGEKPFACQICPASFAQSSDLTKHMRVHTRERPWQCTMCEKTFADASSFARHRRKHEKMEKKAKKVGKQNENAVKIPELVEHAEFR